MPRPPSILDKTINQLATRFASELLAAVASSSLDELRSRSETSAPPRPGRPRGKHGRPATAPKGDRSEVLGRVLGLLRKHRKGLRVEDVRRILGLEKPAFVRAAADGLATHEIRKEGHLRATKYFATE